MKAHPAADIFPLMAEDELQALAEDIKANGQQHPIVVLDGQILDGRNRFRACELAGVEPTFADANGTDPWTLVVSLNVKRRNLTASQRAVAAAEAGSNIGTGRANRKAVAEQFGISTGYLGHAVALHQRAPDLAEAVKLGAKPLAEAYDELRTREGKLRGEGTKRAELAERHPDLAEQLDAGTLSLADALAEAKTRDDAEKQRRWAVTMNVVDVLNHFDRPDDSDLAREQAAAIDPEAAAGRGQEITPERLRRVAGWATALADELERLK